MAAYQSDRMRKHWQTVFNLARNVDVLNPTNTIETRGKKHVSPSSFPYMMEFNNIPVEKFINTERKTVVIFCGSFVPQKNPLLAIEGFEQLLSGSESRFPDIELWMFGKGELLPEILDHISKTNNRYGREAIKILPDTQLIESLAMSKIFLSLQDYDNYPSQAIMEAMLFCNSVLSIDNGDTRKLVKEENGNILLKEKDPALVRDGIRRLLDNWKLNKANRELILTEFTARKYARYFFDIHNSISA
jgi:glycosyltransferase involved in cell wall biosynthesis